MEKLSRTSRESETRDAEKRDMSWSPSSLLPEFPEEPGYVFRWIRTSFMGQNDARNVSARLRERWVPVKRSDYPELQLIPEKDSMFPDGIEVGGLLACKTAVENRDARKRYVEQKSADQLNALDNHFLRENDPRMPLSRPERRTQVKVGKQAAAD
jgi:hypothetical protein